MDVTLYKTDLKSEFKTLNPYEIEFKHFKPRVQRIIIAAEKAIYWEGGAYRMITVPTEDE